MEVSWYGARASSSGGPRLPTVAEWEKAARRRGVEDLLGNLLPLPRETFRVTIRRFSSYDGRVPLGDSGGPGRILTR